jgi:acyl carrier protein
MDTLETELRKFVVANFLFGQDDDVVLLDDTSFVEAGILDSTGALELVQHLEERYGLRVEDDEFAPDYLDSISRLASFIRRKQGEPDAGTKFS